MTAEPPTPDVGRLRHHRQEHVLRWWDELPAASRSSLAAQIADIDFDQIAELASLESASVSETENARQESPAEKARRAVPPAGLVRLPRSARDRAAWDAARQGGIELLQSGRVGVVLVAGGEGTRLGFPHPKGQFPIGPVSGKSLFQLLAEQVVARSRTASAPIPYYVMTSPATHDETVAFFEKHSFFGLNPGDVHFFRQGTMPAVDRQSGKLLLSAKHELALNPDGHGGILAALDRSNLLDHMRDCPIDYLYYHQVDNPLARACDPAFLGFHVQHGSEVSTKVVAKLSPDEKMGVAVDVDGRTQIIEYSDMPADVAARRDENDQLLLWAGSTAMHVFSRSFLERLRAGRIALPFHRAIKKVPYIDDAGQLVEPDAENAVKFERFIFDALPLAERALVLEARREEEFCPLKNKSGDFSPEHVRQGMSRLFAGWLRSAGVRVADDLPVEISPLYALDADELAGKLDVSRKFDGPVYLEA
jgi:UDP-N-acetylglucosamine/UDP-N-acetylgalactosamine diphosphorylase